LSIVAPEPLIYRSLVDQLRSRAADDPDRDAIGFEAQNGTQTRWTYAELDCRARAMAAVLQDACVPGDRVLLLLPPGLEYVSAFYASLYAGMIAVPAYPPNPARFARSLPRIEAIVADAEPAVVLADSAVLAYADQLAAISPVLAGLRWLACDQTPLAHAAQWREPDVNAVDLAFLQYTSGSTATPKGVMVSHENLLRNGTAISRLFGLDSDTVGVIWLPPYHDMGLIGGILQPVHSRYPVTLMAPSTFARDPMRWMDAVSRHAATLSGGPDFSYELAARRITDEQIAQLRLNAWRVAFNGAEPIRAEVLNRFAARFAPAGFRREAFMPCYGLAESTLIVTGTRLDEPPVVRPPLPGSPGAAALVGTGRTAPGELVVIVDPKTRQAVAPGVEGEIWVSGPSVARGYWQRSEQTVETFAAERADDPGHPYLRTGDLGLVEGDELFVTGRMKDLLVIRGVKHHPQDVEKTAREAHPSLAAGGGAAFTVDIKGSQQLIVVHEAFPAQGAELASIKDVIVDLRSAVAREHELAVHDVVLLERRGLPRTSSGKVARHAARAAYLAGDWSAPSLSSVGVTVRSVATQLAEARIARVEYVLAQALSRRLTGEAVSLDRGVVSLGLDSLTVLELAHTLETELGVAVSAEELYAGDLRDVARRLGHAPAVQMTCEATSHAAAGDAAAAGIPLSRGQRALWLIEQLAGDHAADGTGGAQSAFNLACAVRLPAEINLDRLDAAAAGVAKRHPILRASFTAVDGEPRLRVGAGASVTLVHDLVDDPAQWTDEAVAQWAGALAAAPFRLSSGEALRLRLRRGAGQTPVLVMVVHHLVADLWSMTLLLEELVAAYLGTPPRPAGPDFAAFVAAQHRYLDSARGRSDQQFWVEQLGGELPTLDLPTDRPRPTVMGYRGDGCDLTIDADLAERMRRLARDCDTTLFTVLLAAYQALLHRYTGQEDIVVGAPTTGRSRAEFATTVGYLVNPVALRLRHRPTDGFRDLIARTDSIVRAALAHADYPFQLVAEHSRAVRTAGRPPVFQTMLLFQQTPGPGRASLGEVALGRSGIPFDFGGMTLASQAVPQRAAQFELTLSVAESACGDLLARFQYNRDLFEAETIEGLATDFHTLVTGAVAQPNRSVRTLPLLGSERRHLVLDEWNATAHEPFATPASLSAAVRAQATRSPGATALVHHRGEYTYAQLQRRVDALAERLRGGNIGRGHRVAVCARRGADLVCALLGVLACGAAYVPLDPGYPAGRLATTLFDAEVSAVMTTAAEEPLVRSLLHAAAIAVPVLVVDDNGSGPESNAAGEPAEAPAAIDPAYVLYTSGSTGRPKGVVVTHGNLLNFFAAMDETVGCDSSDTVLAVTSVSFDISVLELLWPLARGARVVLAESIAPSVVVPAMKAPMRRSWRPLDLSLFYFASADASANDTERYRLVLDGARFADTHGFRAVWTPERHFHQFGGLYPNPSVLSAAIAAVTTQIDVRAGSVVLPLHSSLRVAEEWALVDNISRGRVGIAFASGWHTDDFAFFPDRYTDRKQHMLAQIAEVHRLWAGESLRVRGGAGNEIDVRVFPKPVQPTLPTWVTASGSPETFRMAGESGSNLLTHLLGQTVTQVATNISVYRRARAEAGYEPETGTVTLMLHTFVGDDRDAILQAVRGPFTQYLRSSVGLIENFVRSMDVPLDLAAMSEADMTALLDHAFERYAHDSALFATPGQAIAMLRGLQDVGVDEIACLIDFGLSADDVLSHLPALNQVRKQLAEPDNASDPATDAVHEAAIVADPATMLQRYRPTLLQSTPSLIKLLAAEPEAYVALANLRALLLGGEALPSSLADSLRNAGVTRLLNMYGPTETTVWSTVHELGSEIQSGDASLATVPIGFPIRNTRAYVLGPGLEPAPPGVSGELYIAGAGVALGYWRRPDLTAAAFIPDPYGQPGSRMYRTGDITRRNASGVLEFLGRADRQVKIRGHRVEPGEIEAVLIRHPDVAQCVVTTVSLNTASAGDVRLIAFIVPTGDPPSTPTRTGQLSDPVLRAAAAELPAWTVPSEIVRLSAFPLTANGKIDLAQLPRPYASSEASHVPPTTNLERTIGGIWAAVLHTNTVGVHDNFFDVGGHSLLMAQIHERLRSALDRRIALVELFEFPTIRSLADHLGATAESALLGSSGASELAGAARPSGSLDDSVARAQRQRAARRGPTPPTGGHAPKRSGR
jgi:natural product biosynthesis luciferase-like monooxygenase protein